MDPLYLFHLMLAYAVGGLTGYYLYKRTLIARVCLAFDEILKEKNRKK